MESDRKTRTSQLLTAVIDSDPAAADELVPLIYDELHEIAVRLLRNKGQATLQATELIHEAYVRLQGNDRANYEGRVHFTRVAARAMRYVLVDRARTACADKRGGGRRAVTLETQLADVAGEAEGLLFVHEGLEQLAEVDDQLAQIVELRFFGGMSREEIAAALDISERTVTRGWRTARAWWVDQFGAGAA